MHAPGVSDETRLDTVARLQSNEVCYGVDTQLGTFTANDQAESHLDGCRVGAVSGKLGSGTVFEAPLSWCWRCSIIKVWCNGPRKCKSATIQPLPQIVHAERVVLSTTVLCRSLPLERRCNNLECAQSKIDMLACLSAQTVQLRESH